MVKLDKIYTRGGGLGQGEGGGRENESNAHRGLVAGSRNLTSHKKKSTAAGPETKPTPNCHSG